MQNAPQDPNTEVIVAHGVSHPIEGDTVMSDTRPHRDPRRWGTNDMDNLQTLCKPCNTRKRDRVMP
jgi:hypothetical protein